MSIEKPKEMNLDSWYCQNCTLEVVGDFINLSGNEKPCCSNHCRIEVNLQEEIKNLAEMKTTAVADGSFMLARANEHIQKLEQELKNQTSEYMKACEKMTYYRTMLMKILDL